MRITFFQITMMYTVLLSSRRPVDRGIPPARAARRALGFTGADASTLPYLRRKAGEQCFVKVPNFALMIHYKNALT